MMHVYRAVCYTKVRCSHKRDKELTLHQTEMRMITWMCSGKSRDKVSCVELRQWLGIDDIAKVFQRTKL